MNNIIYRMLCFAKKDLERIIKQIRKPKPCITDTVTKHDGHFRTRLREMWPAARVFYISRMFSNVRSVFSQCNTRLRLLYLLYDTDFTLA